jgi:hypothetical protein
MLLSVSAALNKVMGFVFAGNLTCGWRPPTGHQCIDEKNTTTATPDRSFFLRQVAPFFATLFVQELLRVAERTGSDRFPLLPK